MKAANYKYQKQLNEFEQIFKFGFRREKQGWEYKKKNRQILSTEHCATLKNKRTLSKTKVQGKDDDKRGGKISSIHDTNTAFWN